MNRKKGPPDLVLLAIVLTLLGIGLLMVFSSSSVTAGVRNGDPYYYLKRQSMWAVLGLTVMFIIMKIDIRIIKALAYIGMIFTIICLALVITPLGLDANGATRWLGVGSIGFSPSDLAKPAIVLYMARLLSNRLTKIQDFIQGLGTPLFVLMVACGLIMLQPDLGTTVDIAGTVYFMLWAAGARIAHMIGLALTGVAGVVAMIFVAPYRLERFLSYLDPFDDPIDTDFQIVQSLYAIGSGGLFGVGIGQSRQKYFYLPEQHTDFIFAIVGEELGFIGCAFVILLFILLAWRGFKIAMEAEDPFISLLAAGLTCMIVFQAFINIGVVTATLPVTGITLPFISYGGSSLLFTLIAIGMLLNASCYAKKR